MRVAIFQTNLKVGGIQRSLSALTSLLCGCEDIEADIFINDGSDRFFCPCTNDRVRVYYTRNLPYISRLVPFSLAYLLWKGRVKKDLEAAKGGPLLQYDAAMDFDSYQNACAIGALSVDAKKRICWVHNDVERKLKNEWKYRLLRFFFKGKYGRYDTMAMVSTGVRDPFFRVNKNAPKRNVIINNAVDTRAIRESLKDESSSADKFLTRGEDCIEIVSLGRLCVQKGYFKMLDLISDVAEKRSREQIHFTVIGDGPLRESLNREVRSRDLDGYITFTGNLKNPFPLMAGCDAFLTCSEYEGQPLSIMEASALNLPVIMPKHLEENAGGIKGSEDMTAAVLSVKKREDRGSVRDLDGYNSEIIKSFRELIL